MMPAGDEDSWYQAKSDVEEGFEECSDFSESYDDENEDEEDMSSVE